MFRRKAKPLLGLDVGSGSVKAIQLRRGRMSTELTHVGLERLALETVVDSTIAQPGALSEAISRMCNERQIKTREVAGAVCGHAVIVKRIVLPVMGEAEVADTVTREAAQHIPFDLEDVNLDYQVLAPEADGSRLGVLLVAVKKDKIANYSSVLTAAGKTPVVMDLDTLALVNCYEFNYEPSPDSVVALLNVGASVMNIDIVKGASPLFPRDVSVGGHQYTDSLQKEFDLSFDDAEALKLGNGEGPVTAEARNAVLQQVTEILVLEIQKTFDFFRASTSGEHIEKMYVAGGSCKVPGLMESLRHEFAIPVELLNPFARISVPDSLSGVVNENAGQFAVAVGLGLRSTGES